MNHLMALVPLGFGTVAMMFSAIGLLAVRNLHDRLHFVAPAATVGMPLVGVAVAMDMGMTAATVKVVLIVVLTALASPIVSAAMGFVIRREE